MSCATDLRAVVIRYPLTSSAAVVGFTASMIEMILGLSSDVHASAGDIGPTIDGACRVPRSERGRRPGAIELHVHGGGQVGVCRRSRKSLRGRCPTRAASACPPVGAAQTAACSVRRSAPTPELLTSDRF